MTFANREDAGRQLAQQLGDLAHRKDVIVLGIPRGGVPVAFQIASALGVPLDIFLSRKLGVPGHEELAFGAIAAGNGRYLDESVIRGAGISAAEIEQVTRRVKEILNERATQYRGNQSPIDVAGKVVILVDDGIATGASVYAAIHALRQMKPAMIVLAVPVMPASTRAWLGGKVERLVCLYAPVDFYAVGQFYIDFGQVPDEEVVTLLRQAGKAQMEADPLPTHDVHSEEVLIDVGAIRLAGKLSVPDHPTGLVLFVHGSGSSRHSPRNRFVAQMLQSRGLATLLFDLLTDAEERVDQHTSQYRFNIELLSQRLIEATHWAQRVARVKDLPIGYFGASTGAAAALIAAAELPDQIAAVVSRGGRPDLAGDYLLRVKASVLLIVGGKDDVVLGLNKQALQSLGCKDKQLVVIPKATHLFEEEGTLEQAARQAADWFVRTLTHSKSSTHPTAAHA
jgi:putative phosphoribosyl transferase